MNWKPIGCPKCHLNRFGVQSRPEEQESTPAQQPWQPVAPTPVRETVTMVRIACQNCAHVLGQFRGA